MLSSCLLAFLNVLYQN